MTSKNTFPKKLTKVDELIRPDHYYLCEEDLCYFIGEYTARKGYTHSSTNSLISNLKKSVERRGRPEWKYKVQAIKKAAAAFRASMPDNFLDCATFIPIPPSKAKSDPLYDDRITKLINEIRPHPALDVRELVVQKISTKPVHSSEQRMSPDDIEAIYSIDTSMLNPPIKIIAIFDDMLTTGAHYRAMVSLLSKNIHGVQIAGFFVARRVPETIDFDEIIFE